MSGKPRKTPSAKAQAYIDAYLRNKSATCHDIDRLFGVEGVTAYVLRRWGIPQRYEPGGGNGNLLKDRRFRRAVSMPKVKKITRNVQYDEVRRRLIERSVA